MNKKEGIWKQYHKIKSKEYNLKIFTEIITFNLKLNDFTDMINIVRV